MLEINLVINSSYDFLLFTTDIYTNKGLAVHNALPEQAKRDVVSDQIKRKWARALNSDQRMKQRGVYFHCHLPLSLYCLRTVTGMGVDRTGTLSKAGERKLRLTSPICVAS